MANLALLLALFIGMSQAMSLPELAELVDYYEDELLTHKGLNPQSEEVERPPHPVGVHNFGHELNVGQVSDVAVDPETDQPVILQRGQVIWDADTFDEQHKLIKREVIAEDTILTLDTNTGKKLKGWGANRFYVPHGLTIDNLGNVYVTDVGTHQVLRFPRGSEKADLVLGEQFVPGSDSNHFCQPTSTAVASVADAFFVADGYCNSRVLKFAKNGDLIKAIEGPWNVVHSVALFESEDVLCLSDRENQRIVCVHAGLASSPENTGKQVLAMEGVGRSFGLAAKGSTLLSVNGAPMPRGLTIDTSMDTPAVVDMWGVAEGLRNPHAVAVSALGDAVYVAEANAVGGRIVKFQVVLPEDEDEEEIVNSL